MQEREIMIKSSDSNNNRDSNYIATPSIFFEDGHLSVIFIYMYLQEVNKIVKQGIKSSYIQKERNLTYYKGKLNVAQHIRKNLVHQEKFYVIYDEFNAILKESNLIIKTGVFGGDMKISSINDGPVTILLEE